MWTSIQPRPRVCEELDPSQRDIEIEGILSSLESERDFIMERTRMGSKTLGRHSKCKA